MHRLADARAAQVPAQPPRLVIVVPTFNEAANVVPLYERVRLTLPSPDWEMIFVDDDSPDGTVDEARSLSLMDARVRCIRRIGRRGLASACIEGALASGAPYIAVMDGDLQHDEAILPAMLQALETGGYDIAVGSRHVEGGGMGDLASRRVFISDVASRLGRRVLRADLSDPMSGYFMVRRDFFEATAPHLSNDGFKILFDLFASAPRPARFVELPYTFRARVSGESKLDARVALDYLKLIVGKLTRGLVPTRFIFFGAVGSLGLLVHLAVLGVANRLLGVEFLAAQASATLVAMTFNYCLNNAVTYRDRRRRGWRFFSGFASFVLICSFGVVANVGLAGVLFARTPVWWLAGAAGAVVGAVWNYAMVSTFTWKRG
jgi:dolichol-phosphate mannosyltransferase